MVSDTDIYRSAKQVIDKCGSEYDPVEYALFRSKTLREEGDDDGAEVWQRIAKAVTEIKDTENKSTFH